MSERAAQLHTAADDQIAELTGLLTTLDDDLLRRGGTTPPSAHRLPGFLRRFGHRRPGDGGHGAGAHGNHYTADSVDSADLINQLSASRQVLAQIAMLSDSQLDTIPPEGSFRFCDGQRTLAQVLTSLLKHQGHQVQALKASLE